MQIIGTGIRTSVHGPGVSPPGFSQLGRELAEQRAVALAKVREKVIIPTKSPNPMQVIEEYLSLLPVSKGTALIELGAQADTRVE